MRRWTVLRDQRRPVLRRLPVFTEAFSFGLISGEFLKSPLWSDVSAMEVKLLVTSGNNAGQVVPVAGPKFLIGRGEDCDLRPRSDLVSRHHCVILVEDAYVALRDFGSKNGTLVNGQPVANEVQLKNGDRLTVGQLEFEVQLAVDVGGKKKPKVESVQEAAARTVESAADDDLDINDWLVEEGSLGATDETEIRTIDATQTGTASSEETVEVTPESPQSESPDEGTKQEERTDSAERWKEKLKKTSSKTDSGAVAAEALQNFLKKRR